MTVVVEKFDISLVPGAGRPRIVSFTSREGELSVHCSREDGGLWLLASGPSHGDRGRVVVPVKAAESLAAWLDSECRDSFRSGYGDSCTLMLGATTKGARAVALTKITTRYNASRWSMVLDADAEVELVACLREWVLAAMKLRAVLALEEGR